MRVWAALLLATSACANAELSVATVSGVRIQPADEDSDEWLHNHCVFNGVVVIRSTAEAVAIAQGRRSNFVEPLSQSVEERGLWKRTTGYGVAFFACKESPPW
jgi:hypothetical protein